MRKLLIIALVLMAGMVFAQGKNPPGWLPHVTVFTADTAFDCEGATIDYETFDLRNSSFGMDDYGRWHGPMTAYITDLDSIDGNTSLTVEWTELDEDLAVSTVQKWHPLCDHGFDITDYDFADNGSIGPILFFPAPCHGIAFRAWNTTSTDTSAGTMKLVVGQDWPVVVSKYALVCRYLDEYYEGDGLVIGSTDTLIVNYPLHHSVGYVWYKFTATGDADDVTDSVYCDYTPMDDNGNPIGNRIIALFSESTIEDGETYEYKLDDLSGCNQVRVRMWMTDCTNDSLTIGGDGAYILNQMGAGR